MTDLHEVIAAFIDGERVDSSQLAQALSAPEGRGYLIDLLALRELVEDQTNTGSAEIVRRESPFRWQWLSLAAAALVVVTLGGYAAGLRQGQARESIRDAQIAAPPTPTPLSAPAPTQVIRFHSGVNWQEQIGGH